MSLSYLNPKTDETPVHLVFSSKLFMVFTDPSSAKSSRLTINSPISNSRGKNPAQLTKKAVLRKPRHLVGHDQMWEGFHRDTRPGSLKIPLLLT